jgi:hypothetical protein
MIARGVFIIAAVLSLVVVAFSRVVFVRWTFSKPDDRRSSV